MLPYVPSDLLVTPEHTEEAASEEELGNVMERNGARCIDYRNKLIRWQEWYNSAKNGG